MPRHLIDAGPFTFDQLRLPHASESDLETARKVAEKFFPGVELAFAKFAVPVFELIESNVVWAVITKQLPIDAYVDWRNRGAPEAEMRQNFAEADAAQRQKLDFAHELERIETLERVFAEGATTDPLIARSLEQPLSTGEYALFIIDGRHRHLAAAATGVDELEVYIGREHSGSAG